MKGDRLALVGGTNLAAAALAPGCEQIVVEVGGGVASVIDRGDVVLLDRHGSQKRLPAHRIAHEVNLEALVTMGCDRVLAVGSVGSLRTDWPVGTVMAPDDFFAPWSAPSRFDDARGHSVAGFDPAWRRTVIEAWQSRASSHINDGGVYAQTRGPRFETPAEVRFLAGHADVVGMTLASECILAREFGLRYAAVCVVDNVANGLDGERLTVDEFEAGVAANRDRLITDLTDVVEVVASR